jgi:hypothetical protein
MSRNASDAERDQDDVVEIAEDRDEVRDEVDRRQRVRDDPGHEQPRVPRRPPVAGGEVERERLRFQPARAVAQRCHAPILSGHAVLPS